MLKVIRARHDQAYEEPMIGHGTELAIGWRQNNKACAYWRAIHLTVGDRTESVVAARFPEPEARPGALAGEARSGLPQIGFTREAW